MAPWRELQFRIDDVLTRAGGRPGHIFNLGHGILPETPVDNVKRLVEYVHTKTGYRTMAQDEEREAEALEWAEATISDVGKW